MEVAVNLLSWTALLSGGALVVVGGIGMLRLPDFFSRIHASGVIDTLGTGLVLFGLALQSGLSLVTVKLVLIFLLIQITSPTAAHALAKAALHGGQRPRAREEGE